MSNFGVIARGVKLPIIRSGDDIVKIVTDTLLSVAKEENVEFKDGDIIAVTESIVARAENNYVTVDDIADDITAKFGERSVIGVLWPIYSRNRFSLILKGIARAASKVIVQLHNGKDEVGNDIFNTFTGVNIEEFYKQVIEKEGAEPIIIKSDDMTEIAKVCNNIIVATIHSRNEVEKQIREYSDDKWGTGIIKTLKLDDICNNPNNGSGFNRAFGLLGSNKATEVKLKLFPKTLTCANTVLNIQQILNAATGKKIEVMIYGDGCFKDPVCGIWEFADPIVSPARTTGLEGTPNELKLKYLVDNNLDGFEGEQLINAVKKHINEKDNNLVGSMKSQGTTPRQYTDLLGSLSDLISGSGDRGTPVVWIQNYFTNYAD